MQENQNDHTGIPAGMVATFSLAWTGVALTSAAARGFKPDPAAATYFDACYRCALSFVFNPSFPLNPIRTDGGTYGQAGEQYLGYVFFEPSPEIGLCRCDALTFLLDREDGIPTRLLQLHIKPLEAREGCSGAFIGAFATYAGRFAPAAAVTSSTKLDPVRSLWDAAIECQRTGPDRLGRKAREYALAHSYFLLSSVFNIDSDRFENRTSYSRDIYRLLYLHAEGVQKTTDEKVGKGKGWTSTDFFETWYQPGGMVVLSKPYPDQYRANLSKLHAVALDTPAHEQAKSADGVPAYPSVSPDKSDYDALPEYPALRYVTPVVAIYGLLYEEVLRDTYERLIEMHKATEQGILKNFVGLLARHREVGRLTRRLARIDTLEHLRLPVSRSLGDLIISSKLQSQVGRAIDQLRVTQISTAVTTLSMIGVSVAITALILSVLRSLG